MSEVVRDALQSLDGLRLLCIGRATNLLWVQFGEWQETTSRNGTTRAVGEWALHIQCPWRITRSGSILVGSRDYYYDDAGKPYDDWSKAFEGRFDHLAAALNGDLEAAAYQVAQITCDPFWGFSMTVTPDLRLDVFPNGGLSPQPHYEFWRLLQPATREKHFVVDSEKPPAPAQLPAAPDVTRA